MAIRTTKVAEAGDEVVARALGQIAEAQTRKARRSAGGGIPWKLVVLASVAVIGLLLLDLRRREGAEYRARVVSTSGQVWVQPAGQTKTSFIAAGGTLAQNDIITTGVNSNAVLAFPEGSTMVLEPRTTFTVRLLEYDRRGRRDRSFMVTAGKVWSQVSEGFGTNSQMDICTPTAVAAVRGTIYSVGFDEKTRATSVGVQRGQVGFATPLGRYDGATPLTQGRAAVATGYQLGSHQLMTPEQLREAQQAEQLLLQHRPRASGLQALEMKVAEVAYVPLGWIGIGPKSWITRSFDTGVRQRATQAMKQLHFHMVNTQTEGQADFPEFVNPVTLEELKIAERDRDQILLSLAGNRIELYQQYGRGYRLTAFGKDSKRTAYEINDKGKVEVIDALRARTLLQYSGVTQGY